MTEGAAADSGGAMTGSRRGALPRGRALRAAGGASTVFSGAATATGPAAARFGRRGSSRRIPTAAAATGTGTITDDDEPGLQVETAGRPGTAERPVNGHVVTVVEGEGVPAGVVVVLPDTLDRDVVLRFSPPGAGVPLESARFGLGETADRRTVVDVTAEPVPDGGVELCLPVTGGLRAEAGGRGLQLLRYGASGWLPVEGGRGGAGRGQVCASGLTAFSAFAAGYGDLKPGFGDAEVPGQRYVQGMEIAPLTLPAATGGDGPLVYTLAGPSGGLPEGLVWTPPADAATGGTLTGTPAEAAPAAIWTLTATDADGDRATLTFSVVVEEAADLRPSFGDAEVPGQRYVQGTEIAPLTLPAATGGDGPLVYTLAGPSGGLPEGLVWTPPADAATGGTLTGTPTEAAPAAVWTLTATDADGDRATLTFTIEVLDRLRGRGRLKGVHEAILPDLSRAMAASTVDAVAGRIGQALFPDGAGATAPADALAAFTGVVQVNEQAIEDGEWSWKQGLDGQSFAFALSGGGGDGAAAGSATGGGARGSVTVWGAGDYRSLSGGEGSGVDWDGHLFGAHLGLDARFGAGGLAGLALSVSEGRFDYVDDASVSVPGEAVEGEYESGMTSVHPYLGWAWSAGTHTPGRRSGTDGGT